MADLRIVWHYTYDHHINEILASGVLLPPLQVASTVEGTPEHLRHTKHYLSDKKMLLFSSNDYWEPASYRMWAENGTIVDLLNRGDYEKRGSKIYRFGVDRSVLHPWIKLKRLAHMPRDMAQGLENIAKRIGSNPYDWWGTLRPVPQPQWETVEVLEGEEWKEFAVAENSR